MEDELSKRRRAKAHAKALGLLDSPITATPSRHADLAALTSKIHNQAQVIQQYEEAVRVLNHRCELADVLIQNYERRIKELEGILSQSK